MNRTLPLILLLAACGSAPAPATVDTVTEHEVELAPLPCGAASVEQLEANASEGLGRCVVMSDGERFELQEAGRPVLRGGEAKPLVALDPRIPGPAGLRVGMTGRDVRAAAPAYAWIGCIAYDERFQCELRRVEDPPECGEGDPDDLIWFELAVPEHFGEGDVVEGKFAWEQIVDAPLTGVVLSMPC